MQVDKDTKRSWFQRVHDFFTIDLWTAEQSRFRVVRVIQFAIVVGEGFVRDQLLLRASALTYFTVLSLIPTLAVVVSIASAVGVGLEGYVDWVLSNIAAGNPEARQSIRELVENANFASLGTFGAVALFLTSVLAIGNIEKALNSIWGVTRGRSWARRVPDYLAVLVVGPILVGAAISLATSFNSQWMADRMIQVPVFEELINLGLTWLPTTILCFAYSALYWFLPNTRVRVLSALVGGVSAAVITVIAQNLYVDFAVGVTRANAFFGGFAALPLLLLWIYFFWAIFLFGAELAFAHQNLQRYRREVRVARAGPAEREAVGLRIAIEVARRFHDAVQIPNAESLADGLDLPVRIVRDVAATLESKGILSTRIDKEDHRGYQLGRPAESILVVDVLSALRGGREHAQGDVAVLVESVLTELEEGAAEGAAGRTLADLIAAMPSVPRGPEEKIG